MNNLNLEYLRKKEKEELGCVKEKCNLEVQ